MKKLLFLSFAAASFTACNDQAKSTDSTVKDTVSTVTPVVTAPDNTMATTTTTTTTTLYAPAEGDVMYKDGKVMVYKEGKFTAATKNVELDNGVIVQPDGEVIRNDEYVTLNDGETVSKTGKFFNKAGNVIDDGWQGAKKGVRKAGEGISDGYQGAKKGVIKAGEAVKKAGKKTGEAVKDAVN